MKRAFKTLGIFLSAFFLLTACSSDDALNSTVSPMAMVGMKPRRMRFSTMDNTKRMTIGKVWLEERLQNTSSRMV